MPEPHPPASAPAQRLMSRSFEILALLFGVALPLLTLGVELTLGMNADVFFDPVPTYFHVLLVAFVPAANFAVWQALRTQQTRHLPKLAFAGGCAIGIATFYTVLFLPVLPLGAIALLYFGLGVLPLTPLLSLIVALGLQAQLSKLAGPPRTRLRAWHGVVAGLLALLVLDAPVTLTRIGMQMATADTAETRLQGIRWLRMAGSEEQMLRMCYVRAGKATDMFSFLFNLTHSIDTNAARDIYYRVTGVPFNARPAPVGKRVGRFGPRPSAEWDFEQGSESTGGRLRGLSLAASRLDGSLDGNAALGYLEWTLVFKNTAPIAREARSQIALPPGAVVSRLTLWIDGEEREAAFAGRGEVRAAYQSVVRRNRDPVLVTTVGQDRIAMQLFPVPPNGEMKVRVGMTVPLALRSQQEGVLRLPYFHERNFDTGDLLRHSVWIESKTPLRSAVTAASDADDVFSARFDMDDDRLGTGASSIIVERNASNEAWAADSKEAGYLVQQRITDREAVAPKKLVVVMDGSSAMSAIAPRIAKTFTDLPPGIELELLIAHDEVIEHRLSGPQLARELQDFTFDGGHDNTEALARGIGRALSQPGSVVLWIHGPQPVLLATEEALLQILERRTHLPAIYELQPQPGINLVGEKLEGHVAMTTLRSEDLQPLILGWRQGARQIVVQRTRLPTADAAAMPPGSATSDHLVRLWASDEIARLLNSRRPHAAIVSLAQRYQLVTAVTGAVVLETRQQYDAAGLEPVPPGTVPTIPEPETWALIAIVLLVLAYAYRNRRAEVGMRHAG